MTAAATLASLWTALAAAVAAGDLPRAWTAAAEVLALGRWIPSAAGLVANVADAGRTLGAAVLTAGPAYLAGDLLWPWLARGARRLRTPASLPLGIGALGFLLYGLLLT